MTNSLEIKFKNLMTKKVKLKGKN